MTNHSGAAQASRVPMHWGLTATAWAIAVGLAVAAALWAPEAQRYEWVALCIGATMLVSFVLQLGTAQRDGFITRLSYSVVGGSFLIGVVTLVAFIVR